MSDDEIKAIVEGAFRPFSCVAKIDDYGEKLKMRVAKPRQDLILEVEVPFDQLRDSQGLEDGLDSCRAEIAMGVCKERRDEVDKLRRDLEADENPIELQDKCQSLWARLDELGNWWIKEFGQLTYHSDLEGPIHDRLSSLREDLDRAQAKLRDKVSETNPRR
jgi:hypothetical protein